MSLNIVNSFKTGAPISVAELKAYYNFNESVGTGTAFNTALNVGSVDSLLSAADMTLTGVVQSNIGGKIEGEATWNGTSSFGVAGVGNNVQWNFMHNQSALWTVTFWSQRDQFDSQRIVLNTTFDTGSGSVGVFQRFTGAGAYDVNFSHGGGAANRFQSNFILNNSDNAYHYYAITMDINDATNTLEMFQDNVSLGTFAKGTSIFSNNNATGDQEVGTAEGNTQFYGGALDEMTIWNRRLTNAELSTLFNGGVGIPL